MHDCGLVQFWGFLLRKRTAFGQTNNIRSITELLDTLKLQGHLVPSPLHIPTEWEDLYEEAVEVVECIDFTWKDRIVATGWGEKFEDSNEEQASEKLAR